MMRYVALWVLAHLTLGGALLVRLWWRERQEHRKRVQRVLDWEVY